MARAIEEHGGGKQLVRFRSWPKTSLIPLVLLALFGFFAVTAVLDRSWIAAGVGGLMTLLLGIYTFRSCATAAVSLLHTLRTIEKEVETSDEREGD